jgi:SAM-dependent methyltransferase
MDLAGQQEFLKATEDHLDIGNGYALRPHYCEREIGWLRRACPEILKGGRVLDVGSAEGSFVMALNQQGAKASGLEPIGKLARHAQENNLDVRQGFFDGAQMSGLEKEVFDLISLRAMIHYLPDLKETFSLLRGFLRQSGFVYIMYHQPESYWYWSHHDLIPRYGAYVQGIPTLPALKYPNAFKNN